MKTLAKILTTSCLFVAACFSLAQVQPKDGPVSVPQKNEAIEGLIDQLVKHYIFLDKAKEAETMLRQKIKSGAYDEFSTGLAFARKLRQDVDSVLKDAHFNIRFFPEKIQQSTGNQQPTQAEIEEYKNEARRMNGGVEKAERLRGNIGYLEVRAFQFDVYFQEAIAGAMTMLANTDALILDLRRNGGGSPEMVQVLCTYFFDTEPVHLNSLYYRERNHTREFYTLPSIPGPRYLNKPVYVLVGGGTGSAAEECAYNLQTQKRATIIGEKTWGGANPGGMYKLSDYFVAFIPTGMAINPITKTNWEHVGVKPDIEMKSAEALVKTQIIAIKKSLENTKDNEWKESLRGLINELENAPTKPNALMQVLSNAMVQPMTAP